MAVFAVQSIRSCSLSFLRNGWQPFKGPLARCNLATYSFKDFSDEHIHPDPDLVLPASPAKEYGCSTKDSPVKKSNRRRRQGKKIRRFTEILSRDGKSLTLGNIGDSLLLPRRRIRNQLQWESPPTFKQVLAKSSLIVEDTADIEAGKVFDKAAAFYHHQRQLGCLQRNENEIDWHSAMAVIEETDVRFPAVPVDREELDKIVINQKFFNLAKIINESPTLKRLVDLGVNLSLWEAQTMDNLELALKLDFERDVAPRLSFLMSQGVPVSELGNIITQNPKILEIDLADMEARIEYLQSKNFKPKMIASIISRESRWLNYAEVDIDARLGFFQKKFYLSGDGVRQLTVKGPDLIIWKGVPLQIELNLLAVTDRMGFTNGEARQLLLSCPVLFMNRMELELIEKFELVYQEFGISRKLILKYPAILTASPHHLRPRHLFLKKLKRHQYDPMRPNYVSPRALCEGSDAEFANSVAKAPVELFNKFILSL